MKIAFISTFFTGATLPLMKYLSERGHKTDLYLICKQGQKGMETMPYDEPIKGDKIVQLNKSNQIYKYLNAHTDIFLTPYFTVRNRRYLVGFLPYFRNRLIFHKMISKILAKKYDAIYLIATEEHDAIICRSLKRRGFKNIIVAYHEVVESHVEKPQLKYAVRQTMDLGFPLVTYSKNVRDELSKLSGLKNIDVCNFGPFETYHLFDSDVPLIAGKYVLFIGAILPYKGLSFFHDTVCNQLKGLDCNFVVAGSGKDSTLEKIKSNDRFTLVNRYLSETEFANFVRFASCIVCPYVAGSQSGITQTAMVYGTPVVATKVGAFSEFIEEGKNGYLVDYGNEEQLAVAIRKIVVDKKYQKSYVPKQLDWNTISKEVEHLLSLNKSMSS